MREIQGRISEMMLGLDKLDFDLISSACEGLSKGQHHC
jgi:hypothetical protein